MAAIGGSAVLTGALNGKAALIRLVETTAAEPPKPAPVFLDFCGVEVADRELSA